MSSPFIRIDANTGGSTHHIDVMTHRNHPSEKCTTISTKLLLKLERVELPAISTGWVVAGINIGFTKHGEGRCEICNLNDKHTLDNNGDTEECTLCNINDKHTHDNNGDTEECTLCKSWLQHIENAKLSRENYRPDSENNSYNNDEAQLSADVQKVIMVPGLPGNKTTIFTGFSTMKHLRRSDIPARTTLLLVSAGMTLAVTRRTWY